MAKLPFQQIQFLPGTGVADFRTSSITPPPSLEGVIQSGNQFYQAQRDVAKGVMDVTESLAKAIMVDRNEKRRKQKLAESNFKANMADELGEKGFNIFKQSQLDPTGDYENQMLVTGNDILQRYKRSAEDQGFSPEFISSLSPYAGSIIRNQRRGLFLDDAAYAENQRKKRRSVALETELLDYKKVIINTDLDLRENKDWENAEAKQTAIQQDFRTIADRVVTAANGYTGPNFVNEEQLEDEKRRIVNLLEERLVDSGARWKLEALQALDDENSNAEINIFREAENKMLERIATDRVLERINENQDYSGARPEILNVAVDYLEEEAEKLYPKDEKAREKFIENSKVQFQRKYILENNQLNLEAVERTLAEKRKTDAEKEQLQSRDDTTNKNEAVTNLEQQLLRLETEYESGEKTASEVLRETEQNINIFYNGYSKPEEGENAAKNKAYNRELKDLLKRASLDEERRIRLNDARKELAEAKEEDLSIKERRERQILTTIDEITRDYKFRATKIFEQQTEDRMDANAFSQALNDLKEELIFERIGDRTDDPEFDSELATIVRKELDDIFLSSEQQIALQQADEAIDLEVAEVGRALILGREATADGKPAIRGLRQIVEDAEGKGMNVEKTMSEIYTEFEKLDRQLQGELTTDAARHRYSISSDYLEKRDVLIEGARGRVQQRQNDKLKGVIETQVRDVIVGIDRSEIQFEPRTFRDDQNLLTSAQEADWRMANIASILQKHTGPDKLFSVPEARERIRLAAKEIDLADAEIMVDENPELALEYLKIPKTSKKDLKFPGLEPTDRSRLMRRAEANLQTIKVNSKSDLNVQVDNFLRWTLTGDKRAPAQFGIEFSTSPPDVAFFNTFINEHVGPGKLFTDFEGERIRDQVTYAQNFADASNGGNEKYGSGTRLEEKSMVQLQQILEDFQPLNYRENNAAKPDAAFLERTYNMIQTRVNNIISKRSADPAFYPLMQYMESRQGQQVSQFDESRMDYIIQKQQEFGGEIRLFTNDEVEALNENWSTMNALERSNYLKQMKEQSRRPELFGQMFSEMATGNNVRFSDQVYLEYADDTVVLKKIHATRNLSKGAISESLNMIQEDEQTLALALEDSDKLQDFLAAFNLNKNERFSMFEMVRKYVVGGVDKETSGLDDLVEQAMTDLVDKKYHIFNATPFEEDVEQFSILLPKNKIPDTPTQMPGMYRQDQVEKGPITSSQIGKGLMRFLKEDVPAITTTDVHARLMSSENYFFQNSEDGQGLTLYEMTDSGLTKVGGSRTEIKLNFEKLYQYILEERVKVEPPSLMQVIAPLVQ